ncbi:nucleotide pyrophosphohydrolase [Alcaligenes phenolicus]|uniref:nucleotide pyrophosphohydrolase n=1 Tax=Alcaligenes phenolicus TaxID=232846 RepID=UPI002AA8D732|nr:nucleotide pyrophosphohydrolase [Alcaligenes phenolicus]
MTDPKRPLMNLTGLNEAVAQFAREREWDQFHSPKNLAMALTNEVGELIEIFQWLTEDQSREAGTDPKTAEAVRDELADVQIYLSRLAFVLGVDMNEAVTNKLVKNARKYPADKVRGTNKKYTEL